MLKLEKNCVTDVYSTNAGSIDPVIFDIVRINIFGNLETKNIDSFYHTIHIQKIFKCDHICQQFTSVTFQNFQKSVIALNSQMPVI